MSTVLNPNQRKEASTGNKDSPNGNTVQARLKELGAIGEKKEPPKRDRGVPSRPGTVRPRRKNSLL